MDWQLFLIELYSEVQESYYKELVYHCQKFSNNTDKLEVAFTDVELISVYLFGLIKERHKIKQYMDILKNIGFHGFRICPLTRILSCA